MPALAGIEPAFVCSACFARVQCWRGKVECHIGAPAADASYLLLFLMTLKLDVDLASHAASAARLASG
jgi:hypothetical protein